MTLVLPAVVVLLAAGLLVLSVRRGFLVTVVDGTSMEPALRSGDRVLVRRTKRIRVGQIVVVEFPDLPSGSAPATTRGRQLLVKRVVAVQGDRLPTEWEYPDVDGIAGTVVPPGSVVVLGDNRATSWDSRHYGFVRPERLVGVMLRHLPGSGGVTEVEDARQARSGDAEPT
ncbi:S26 family signal peptidase [Nonomuraea antimicrobica]|uniref:signal peptidase I n=1 Tax=Nonomuraea antimicrobica TaxID=561173 RepID=A0ABP7DU31_9ACTN